MWCIYEKKSLLKKIKRIPNPVLQRYEVWKRIVEWEGTKGLRAIKGFHNESLRGEWRGYRSSRLNQQWRVIYKVRHTVCEVYVLDINPHNYKRR